MPGVWLRRGAPPERSSASRRCLTPNRSVVGERRPSARPGPRSRGQAPPDTPRRSRGAARGGARPLPARLPRIGARDVGGVRSQTTVGPAQACRAGGV